VSALDKAILGITTATPRGGVALVRDGVVLGVSSYQDDMQHGERLFGALEEALSLAGLGRAHIGGIACDVGPGSFTGVRVGLASAKGMALSLGVPLAGVCSLEAMAVAAMASSNAELICAVLDARRSESFVAVYDRDRKAVREPAHVPATDTQSWLGSLGAGFIYCGVQAKALGLTPRIDAPECELPDAAWIAKCAEARLAQGDVPELGMVEPIYLRAPDATPQAQRV
jgi:tRNA threonylcarbamoyladenosine biosynthesis protein TsaB